MRGPVLVALLLVAICAAVADAMLKVPSLVVSHESDGPSFKVPKFTFTFEDVEDSGDDFTQEAPTLLLPGDDEVHVAAVRRTYASSKFKGRVYTTGDQIGGGARDGRLNSFLAAAEDNNEALNEQFVLKFGVPRTEIDVMKRLKGVAGVLHLVDDFESPEGLVLVTKYMPRGSIAGKTKDYPREELIERLRQLASTVARVHDAKVLHGDLREDNVFIDAEGNWVLADFGEALVTDSVSSAAWNRDVLAFGSILARGVMTRLGGFAPNSNTNCFMPWQQLGGIGLAPEAIKLLQKNQLFPFLGVVYTQHETGGSVAATNFADLENGIRMSLTGTWTDYPLTSADHNLVDYLFNCVNSTDDARAEKQRILDEFATDELFALLARTLVTDPTIFGYRPSSRAKTAQERLCKPRCAVPYSMRQVVAAEFFA